MLLKKQLKNIRRERNPKMRARVEVTRMDGKVLVVEGKILHIMNINDETLHIVIVEPDFYGVEDLNKEEND